jgi:cytochrome c oxidase subunit IV
MMELSQRVLDLIGMVTVGLSALSIFLIHVYTGPNKHRWLNLPAHIRVLIFILGIGFMMRSVNLSYVVDHPEMPGHMNEIGIVVSLVLNALFGSVFVEILMHTYPPRVWERLRYINQLARCSRHQQPQKTSAVVQLAANGGIVVGPGGNLKQFVRAVDNGASRSDKSDYLDKVANARD